MKKGSVLSLRGIVAQKQQELIESRSRPQKRTEFPQLCVPSRSSVTFK